VYISENEVRRVLTYEALIPAIRRALIDYSAGCVQQPARMIMRTGNAEGHRNGWFALMPVIHGDVMGVKTVTFYPGNAELGIHTHMAMIELLDRATGEPLAVMDGRLITEMRTAAVSAVAFAALAPLHFDSSATTFGIVGSGVQARAHVRALRHVWPAMSEIRIWSPTGAHAEQCAAELGGRSVSIEEAAAADVVLTATLSAEPVLHGRWLKPNALVFAVGGIGPVNRELDDEVMHTCYLVAEARDCVGRESGDVVGSGAKINAEIGEILARPEEASIPKNGRVLFKTVGMAIEDLTAARLVWKGWNQGNKGTGDQRTQIGALPC
jgi:ornithine cyclodeaminase/alanine dehydrogenase-like protein (mu-crystallin family)